MTKNWEVWVFTHQNLYVGNSLVQNESNLFREHMISCSPVCYGETVARTRGDGVFQHLSNDSLQSVGEIDMGQRRSHRDWEANWRRQRRSHRDWEADWRSQWANVRSSSVVARQVKDNRVVRFMRGGGGSIIRHSIFLPVPMEIVVRFIFFCECCKTRKSRARASGTNRQIICQRGTPPKGWVRSGSRRNRGRRGGEGEGGPFTNLRFSSLRRGQLAGTYHGFSARWQIGQMPVPTRAWVHRVLMLFLPYFESHWKGLAHLLPCLSTLATEVLCGWVVKWRFINSWRPRFETSAWQT